MKCSDSSQQLPEASKPDEPDCRPEEPKNEPIAQKQSKHKSRPALTANKPATTAAKTVAGKKVERESSREVFPDVRPVLHENRSLRIALEEAHFQSTLMASKDVED